VFHFGFAFEIAADPMTGIVDELSSFAGRFQSDPEPHPLHPFAIGHFVRLIL
jgi:hypothetical protein